MQRTSASYQERAVCPLYTAIKVIEGRWKPMIFRRLLEGPRGFGELRRSAQGVAVKVLRQQLRQLEADAIVARSAAAKPGGRARYELTPHGRTLGPVFECLWRWGVRHIAQTKPAATL